MKHPLFNLIFLLFFLFSVSSISAIDISFSDFDLTSQDIDFYFSNGTFIETIRSNESITLNNSFDYQVVFRPQKLDIINNPMAFFRMLVSGDFIGVIISIIVLAGLYKILKK